MAQNKDFFFFAKDDTFDEKLLFIHKQNRRRQEMVGIATFCELKLVLTQLKVFCDF